MVAHRTISSSPTTRRIRIIISTTTTTRHRRPSNSSRRNLIITTTIIISNSSSRRISTMPISIRHSNHSKLNHPITIRVIRHSSRKSNTKRNRCSPAMTIRGLARAISAYETNGMRLENGAPVCLSWTSLMSDMSAGRFLSLSPSLSLSRMYSLACFVCSCFSSSSFLFSSLRLLFFCITTENKRTAIVRCSSGMSNGDRFHTQDTCPAAAAPNDSKPSFSSTCS